MNAYQKLKEHLKSEQYCWLVTGAAGFIGSHLVEQLLKLDQKVIGLDNFSTGYEKNIQEVLSLVSKEQHRQFVFLAGDIRNPNDCKKACKGVDFVLHQAALGSVPRSIEDPKTSHEVNVAGFLNMLEAAKSACVKRFMYASSSAVYGDSEELPKIENRIGNLLSPYAAYKYANELYAGVFAKNYGLETIGFRYFNVFGPRQDPNGAYAAVIPKWMIAMLKSEEISIYGDGSTSRDFCYIDNVVQANLLAAFAKKIAVDKVYNVAAGEQTTLLQLLALLKTSIENHGFMYSRLPDHQEFRKGDIRHSLADYELAKINLRYLPEDTIRSGIKKTVAWFIENA